MKKYFVLSIVLIALAVFLFVSYGAYLNQSSEIYIKHFQAANVTQVVGTKVSYRDILPQIELEGFELQAKNIADISMRIDGIVETIMVKEWQRVKAGDLVATIHNPDIALDIAEAEAGLYKAKGDLSKSENALNRAKKLRVTNSISTQELDEAVAQMQAAEAAVIAANVAIGKAKQRKEYQMVRSPISGDILVLYHQAGNYLPSGTPLMLAGDFSTLTLTSIIHQHELINLGNAGTRHELHFDLSGDTKAFSANFSIGHDTFAKFDAWINSITPPLNIEATYRQIVWRIDNPLNILEPGYYLAGTIKYPNTKRVLAVPEKAFKNPASTELNIFKDSSFITKNVTTGVRDANFVEIISGLDEGDVVILSNIQDLSPGALISTRLVETN